MSNLRRAFFEVVDEPKPAVGVYLSLYRETPFYGGPEEGGWWYNAGSPLGSIPFDIADRTRIPDEIDRLKRLFFHLNEGDIDSVLGGQEVQVYTEDEAAEHFPQERPYYE